MIPSDLHAGYRKFRKERFALEAELYKTLAKEQKPHTLVIGCADSRVDPATIFAAKPGELFVVRNVAALVPPFEDGGTYHGTSAAIEFAVTGLKVSKIIVLGHGLCGGIAASLAAAENRPVGKFVGPWVELLSGVREELLECLPDSQPARRQKALERMAIQLSLDNLLTFPFVEEAVNQRRLSLNGAWFSIAEGRLEWLDWDSGTFEEVSEK